MKIKMKLIASLKIWVVIYPAITLFYFLFGKALAAMALFERTFLLTAALVPWVVFAGVPMVDFIIRLILPDKSKNKSDQNLKNAIE